MLPNLNYVPWGGLEAYRRGVTITNLFWVKMAKNIFRMVSMHYLSNAYVEKGDMLPNYATGVA